MNCLPDKWSNVPLVGRLEVLVVLEPVLLPDDDRRVARLHQDEVHQQPARPPVAVDERVDVDELGKIGPSELHTRNCNLILFITRARPNRRAASNWLQTMLWTIFVCCQRRKIEL